MTKGISELVKLESRVACRLSRLFRLERDGRLERQPIETVRQVIGRRARLIDELMRLDAERRSLAAPLAAELAAAIGELAREARRSRFFCGARIEALAAGLRRRQGAGTATGLRDGADGRLLGSG
jgi:predicted transcriptional regulator